MSAVRILLPWAFWIPFCGVTYFAWTPADPLENPLPYDKFMHLMAFGYLAVAFAVAYTPWATWPRTTGIMLAYGVLIEVVQAFIPTRSCSWLDIVADGIGILLAWIGLYAMSKVVGLLRRETDTP